MLKQLAKTALSTVFPERSMQWQASRNRAHSEEVEKEWGCDEITRLIVEEYCPEVIRGPFEGVEFPREVHHRHIGPKLLGAYESELAPVWGEILQEEYSQILDVGSADGMYAVGLACHYPDTTVHAFDTDEWARRVTKRMALLNGTFNVEVKTACNPSWLSENLRDGAFILCDCEGYEKTLFGECSASALDTAHLLIELHGCEDEIQERFTHTHDLTLIGVEEDNRTLYPELSVLPERLHGTAVSDLRFDADQKWLWAKSR